MMSPSGGVQGWSYSRPSSSPVTTCYPEHPREKLAGGAWVLSSLLVLEMVQVIDQRSHWEVVQNQGSKSVFEKALRKAGKAEASLIIINLRTLAGKEACCSSGNWLIFTVFWGVIWNEAVCGRVEVGTEKREGCGGNPGTKILPKGSVKDKDTLSTATMHRITVEGRRTLKTICSNPFILLPRDWALWEWWGSHSWQEVKWPLQHRYPNMSYTRFPGDLLHLQIHLQHLIGPLLQQKILHAAPKTQGSQINKY